MAPKFTVVGMCAAPDEWLVEAFESGNHRWLVGVQWHPERLYELGAGASGLVGWVCCGVREVNYCVLRKSYCVIFRIGSLCENTDRLACPMLPMPVSVAARRPYAVRITYFAAR